jgi:hypothetical protein
MGNLNLTTLGLPFSNGLYGGNDVMILEPKKAKWNPQPKAVDREEMDDKSFNNVKLQMDG